MVPWSVIPRSHGIGAVRSFAQGLEWSCMLTPFSRFWFLGTPWTIAHQALLFMGFSRQGYWNGLPFPSPRNLPDPGIKPTSLMSLTFAEDCLPLVPPGKANAQKIWPIIFNYQYNSSHRMKNFWALSDLSHQLAENQRSPARLRDLCEVTQPLHASCVLGKHIQEPLSHMSHQALAPMAK